MFYKLLFILAVCVYMFHWKIAGHGIYGDGNGYYTTAHALYFEKKLNYDPIYTHLTYFQGPKYRFSRIFWDTRKGPNGIRYNPWTIGTSLFWIPSLAIINLFVFLFHLQINKFSTIYELGPGISGIAFVVLGLYFLEKYLLNFFKRNIIRFSLVCLIFGAHLLYYLFFEPALSHQVTFFLFSFLLYWTYKLKLDYFTAFSIGFICGLIFITRMADSILTVVVIFWLSNQFQKNKLLMLVIISGFIFAVVPQLVVQQLMYGKFWNNPYFNGANGHFQLYFIPMSLFGLRRGLFIWSPLLIVGLVGIIKSAFIDRLKKTAKIFLITLVIYLIIAGGWSGSISAGFGNRIFIASLPLFTFGLSYLFSIISLNKRLVISICFIIWNDLLLLQFFMYSQRLVNGQGLTGFNFLTGQIVVLNDFVKCYILK